MQVTRSFYIFTCVDSEVRFAAEEVLRERYLALVVIENTGIGGRVVGGMSGCWLKSQPPEQVGEGTVSFGEPVVVY